jgi:ribulose-phosphate 3-epimerase
MNPDTPAGLKNSINLEIEMPVICPSILAADKDQYHQQMEKVAQFAQRVQIDLTDGKFAPSQTVKPQDAWWPVGVQADFHLMYEQPDDAIEVILEHKPHMIIAHAEARGNFNGIAGRLRELGVKAGIAILAKTSVDSIVPALEMADHVLIFSGTLGEYGGHANLDLLKKVEYLKQHKPNIEIGWDGGINTQNISQLAFSGIDVFNVGGFIQDAPNPEQAYQSLQRIAEETGTT